MLKSVNASPNDPMEKASRLEKLPVELIDYTFSKFVLPKDYMHSCLTSKWLREHLMQGASWEAHASHLLPGLKNPTTLQNRTAVINEQYTIRANLSKGKCETIGIVKHTGEIRKAVFAEQPTREGVYILITASRKEVSVTHVGPNGPPRFCDSFALMGDELMDLAVTKNGKYLALALSEDGAMLLPTADLETPPKHFATPSIYGETTCISFSPASTHVITGSTANRGLLVWDIKNLNKPICQISECEVSDGHTVTHCAYDGLQFSPDGQSILAWTYPPNGASVVRLWPNWREKPKKSIIVQDPHHARTGQLPHYGPIVDAYYSFDGRIVTASTDNTVNIYETDAQHNCSHVKQVRNVRNNLGEDDLELSDKISSAHLTDDNSFLLTMTKNNVLADDNIQSWDMNAATPQPRLQNKPSLPEFGDYTTVSRLTRNNKFLAIGDRSNRVAIISYGRTGKPR